MSENIIIKEADQSRAFGGVERLETDTTDGNSCFWVPESERQLESAHITQNGDYTPGKYAFSDITVDVTESIQSEDGTDWDITIQPIDPNIPEIGVPEISIPDSDIDLTVDPATGLPVITVGGEVIDLPDVSEILDLTSDIDVSINIDGSGLNISGIGLDGLGMNLNIDLGTLDISTTNLPTEIRIIQLPDKTTYKDGEVIDLTGIVVQAYNADGTVWTNEQYPDGYIPLSELYHDREKSIFDPDTRHFTIFDGDKHYHFFVTNSLRITGVERGFRGGYETYYSSGGSHGYAMVPRATSELMITAEENSVIIYGFGKSQYYKASTSGQDEDYYVSLLGQSGSSSGWTFNTYNRPLIVTKKVKDDSNDPLPDYGTIIGHFYYHYPYAYDAYGAPITAYWYTQEGDTRADSEEISANGYKCKIGYSSYRESKWYEKSPSSLPVYADTFTCSARYAFSDWPCYYTPYGVVRAYLRAPENLDSLNQVMILWARPIDNVPLKATLDISVEQPERDTTAEESDTPAPATTVNESGFSHHSGKF